MLSCKNGVSSAIDILTEKTDNSKHQKLSCVHQEKNIECIQAHSSGVDSELRGQDQVELNHGTVP